MWPVNMGKIDALFYGDVSAIDLTSDILMITCFSSTKLKTDRGVRFSSNCIIWISELSFAIIQKIF